MHCPCFRKILLDVDTENCFQEWESYLSCLAQAVGRHRSQSASVQTTITCLTSSAVQGTFGVSELMQTPSSWQSARCVMSGEPSTVIFCHEIRNEAWNLFMRNYQHISLLTCVQLRMSVNVVEALLEWSGCYKVGTRLTKFYVCRDQGSLCIVMSH